MQYFILLKIKLWLSSPTLLTSFFFVKFPNETLSQKKKSKLLPFSDLPFLLVNEMEFVYSFSCSYSECFLTMKILSWEISPRGSQQFCAKIIGGIQAISPLPLAIPLLSPPVVFWPCSPGDSCPSFACVQGLLRVRSSWVMYISLAFIQENPSKALDLFVLEAWTLGGCHMGSGPWRASELHGDFSES